MTYLRNPKENSEFLKSEFRKALLGFEKLDSYKGIGSFKKNKKKLRGTK